MSSPVKNGQIARALYFSIREGQAIENIPKLVKQIICDRMWESLTVEETGEVIEFDSFEQMITTEPPEGLGTSIDTLKKLCRDDNEALGLIDEVTRKGPGKTWDSRTNENIHYNVMNNSQAIQGNSKDYGLKRLRKEAQRNPTAKSLQTKVFANEMTVNAALIELGLRQKTITIPLDPEKAARAIKRNFNDEEIERLIDLLS